MDKQTLREGGEVLTLKDNDERMLRILATQMVGRAQLASRLGQSFGTDRDLYVSLGYTKKPVFSDYYSRYSRQDIAKRIIEAYPSACWRLKPTITEVDEKETAFEKEWEVLVKEKKIYQYLVRADKISGIGRYGVILLGFNDGKELDEPCELAYDLSYIRPYHELNVSPLSWVTDVHNPRYGLPESYTIQMTTAGGGTTFNKGVHWTRVIHLAEGLEEGEVYGTPRLKPVLNRLQDLELISGGSSEMFWRGAFPGMAFKADEGAKFTQQTMSDLETEIEEYMHDLKRYLRLTNVDAKSLEQQIADPKGHVDMLVSLIAGATGIPQRMLVGSERGELASTQDETSFNDRVAERRDDYVEPFILRPFIDRLIDIGVLTEPESGTYSVQWPSIHVPSEKERAVTAKTKTEALVTFANSPTASTIVPEELFLKKYMGWSQEEVDQAMDMVDNDLKEERDQIDEEDEND